MPPKTLTRAEFQQQRPEGSYDKYLRWLARMRPVRMQQRQAMLNDPYRPTPDAQLVTRSQQEVYDPYNRMVDALTTSLTGRAALAADRERARGTALAQALAPYASRISGYFNTAASSAGADAGRIAGGLSAQGAQLSGDLGGKLGAIQAPGQAVTQFAGGAQQIGQGAAGAVNALGSAEAARLRGEGAAHSTYAGALPGIEQLKTLKELGLIKEGLSEELLDTIGNLQVEAAREYGSTLRGYRSEERSKAEARYKRDTSAAEAKARAKQEAIDRQYEAAALKQAYGLPLTPRDKKLLNTYGMTPDAVEAAGKRKTEAEDDARALRLQNARDAAALARQQARDAATAAREAKAQAARSKLESDKAKYRAALERQKAANRKALQAQKDLAAAERAAKKGKGTSSGSGSSDVPYFGGK